MGFLFFWDSSISSPNSGIRKTENIFLLVTQTDTVLNCCDEWIDIKKNISHFASLKAKEHTSLSNRCVFKYMDINDKF